jgi:hypothetical protein
MAADCHADLPLVQERAPGAGGRCGLQVGIVEYNEWALAPELECHPLDVPAGKFADTSAHRCGSRKGDPIDEVVSRNLTEHANALGELARLELNRLFLRLNLPWRAYGRFSSFHILPDAPDGANTDVDYLPWQLFARRPRELLQRLRMALILEGVDIASRGTGFLSGMHQTDDVHYLIAAFEQALQRLRRDGALR